MAVSLGSNIAALMSQRRLNEAGTRLSASYERLASGLRINRASDDAAGLAIASTLNAYSRVFSQGVRNINDGISALSIADGSLEQLSGLTTRLKELAMQSANGSLSITQRRALDAEADQLMQEFNRTISTVSFNGLGLLNRSLSSGLGIQAGIGAGAVLNLNINSSLSRGVGDGTFGAGSALGGAAAQQVVETGDFNNDGKVDIASIDGSALPLTIQLGNGDGTFQGADSYGPTTFAGLVVGDFDGNGTLDLISGATSGADITFFSGDGDGGFRDYVRTVGTASTVEAAADFDGDGILDLVGRNGTSVYVYRGTGGGQFSLAKTLNTGTSATDIAVGDMNNDGHAEIVAQATTGITTYSNGGNFEFTGKFTAVSGVIASTIDLGDTNGDGYLDLVFGSSLTLSGFISFLGNGDGTFSQGNSYASGGSARAVKLIDVNGDGILDVLNTVNAAISTRLGNGDGTFGNATSTASGGSHLSLAAADFNGDGASDLVTTSNASALLLHMASRTSTTTLQNINLNSSSAALQSFRVIDDTLTRILNERGDIGTNLSRLESALSTLNATQENFAAAASRIQDVDVAAESAILTRTQILQQSASAVLAQANLLPSLTLQLLRS